MERVILKTDDESFGVDVPVVNIGSEYYIEKSVYEEMMNMALKQIDVYKQAFEFVKRDRYKQVSEMMAHINCLKAELLEVQRYSDNKLQNLPENPIDVATMLIKCTATVKTNSISKAFNHDMPDEYETEKYFTSDLRQIAEYLLVYCNNSEDR